MVKFGASLNRCGLVMSFVSIFLSVSMIVLEWGLCEDFLLSSQK